MARYIRIGLEIHTASLWFGRRWFFLNGRFYRNRAMIAPALCIVIGTLAILLIPAFIGRD